MKTPRTEYLCHNSKPGYRRYAKRRWWKGVRRAEKQDPESAPKKLRSLGWD